MAFKKRKSNASLTNLGNLYFNSDLALAGLYNFEGKLQLAELLRKQYLFVFGLLEVLHFLQYI